MLIEVHCETDFLSRSEAFRSFAKDLAMQVAAEAPLFINAEDIPAATIQQVECEAERLARAQGKPEKVIDQIKAGKVRKFIGEVCLLEQKFIKDSSMTVGDYVRAFVGTSGENVKVEFFARRQLDA